MAKNIVFCADGTWNGPGEADPDGVVTPSNVQILFSHLGGVATVSADGEMERLLVGGADGSPVQVAKYIHGVGDTSNPLARRLEGAVGAGLLARLARGYCYISRHYVPGDRIVIVGFSRGAYTARALADLIAARGLLDWTGLGLPAGGGDATAYAVAMQAWVAYRRGRQAPWAVGGALDTAFHEMFDFLRDLIEGAPAPRYVGGVTVAAVGVWDTVGALGIPTPALDKPARADLFRFVDHALSPAIGRGFHAVSVDERREDFTPTLWDARAGVEQVLFPGAHADVGGGYAPAQGGLSHAPLRWMMDRLRGVGVMFDAVEPPPPDPAALAHRPWAGSAYAVAPRQFRPGLGLSRACVDRVAAGAVPAESPLPDGDPALAAYRPDNLVPGYFRPDWQGPAAGVIVV